MITAVFLLAGVIIDVTLPHWAMITLTSVIAITAAIRYHDVHVVMTTSVVGRQTLSSFTVCRHSRLEIRHIVRGHAIMISMSRRVYGPILCPGIWLWLPGYSCLSRQFCYVCPGVPVPA